MRLGYLYVHRLQLQSSPFAPLPLHSAGGGGSGGGLSVGVCLIAGGIVVAVQRELGVPVKLVGLGEGPDDLAPFDAEAFVDALLD